MDEEELDADLGDYDDDDDNMTGGATAASSHHHSHGRKTNKTPTSSSNTTGAAVAAAGVDVSIVGRAAKREGRSTFSGAFNALGFGSKAATSAVAGGETQTLLPGIPTTYPFSHISFYVIPSLSIQYFLLSFL